MSTPAAQSYRPEIDGLRAVAVVAVLLYHADVPGFAGGFVGVDVFLVISGFLITTILRQSIQRGTFSLGEFYERRIRRIFPALFATLLASGLCAVLVLPPRLLQSFGTDLASAALSVSNIWFWKTSGYFAGETHLNPLIHTWSLALEEQFYLGFPLLLLLGHRYVPRRTPALLTILVSMSLCLCVVATHHWPMAAFYLLPTRAWELGVGALLTWLPTINSRTFSRWGDAATIIGLATIGWCIGNFDDATAFPGWSAVLPVMGAALIVAGSGASRIASAVLANAPVVWLGLISYSLYLVHQPVLAFARIMAVVPLDAGQTVVLLAACVLAAHFSWKWIESPFRQAERFSRRQLFQGAAAIVAITTILGMSLYLAKGWPQRFGDAPGLTVASSHSKLAPSNCLRDYPDVDPRPCTLGDQNSAARFAVIGDSHAWHLLPVLTDLSAKHAWRIDLYAKSACPPGGSDFIYAALRRPYRECQQWSEAINLRGGYAAVLYVSSSAGYRSNKGDSLVGKRWADIVSRALTRADEARVPAIWALDTPRFETFDPRLCVERASLFHAPPLNRCALPAGVALDLPRRDLETSIGKSHGAQVVDLSRVLCDDRVCRAFRNETTAMVDSNHITADTALALEPLIDEALSRFAPAQHASADQASYGSQAN